MGTLWTPTQLPRYSLSLRHRAPQSLCRTCLQQQQPTARSQARPTSPSSTRSISATSTQTLTASRTLPYSAFRIFEIIADIPSYPSFLPYCQSAHVSRWSDPDTHFHRRWPSRATLTVAPFGPLATAGFGEEKWTSAVTCIPPVRGAQGRAGVGIVEAVAGEGVDASTLRDTNTDQAAHHLQADGQDKTVASTQDGEGQGQADSPLALLRTRWTVRGYPFRPGPGDGYAPQEEGVESQGVDAREVADVGLVVEFRFRNPVYDMMSRAVSGKVAEEMMKAFERRVGAVLGEVGTGQEGYRTMPKSEAKSEWE